MCFVMFMVCDLHTIIFKVSILSAVDVYLLICCFSSGKGVFVLNNWYDMQHFLVLLKALTFLPAVTQEYIDERRLDGKNFCILEMHMYL